MKAIEITKESVSSTVMHDYCSTELSGFSLKVQCLGHSGMRTNMMREHPRRS